MSANEPTGREGPRRFTRRQILALGAAGAGLVAFSSRASGQQGPQPGSEGPPPRGQVVANLNYRNSAIRIERVNRRLELYIDDEHIETINNTGEYRAAGFMFSPEPTLEALGKNIVDARRALAARGMQARGKRMIP